jgi:hypothetical protein
MRTTPTPVRLPDDLLQRIDRYLERINRDTPGLNLKRADAIRTLLTQALDAIEKPQKRGK